MLSNLLRESKETERWIDRENRKQLCERKPGTLSSSYRDPTVRDTTHGSRLLDCDVDDNNSGSTNRQQFSPACQQGSTTNRAGARSQIHNHRSSRRSHPYQHKNRMLESCRETCLCTKYGPSSCSYNPAVSYGDYNRDAGSCSDILSPYYPVSSFHNPSLYRQMSPYYATPPTLSPTSPAYTPIISPVYAEDSVSIYSAHGPSFTTPGITGSITRMDGSAMMYSPSSPSYAFCSPHFNNTDNDMAVTQPTARHPCKRAATYRPVCNTTVDGPEQQISKTLDSKGKSATSSSDAVAQLTKRNVAAKGMQTETYSKSTTVYSDMEKDNPITDEHRSAYDPTQPQYSTTYDPTALMDDWYKQQEEQGTLAYDPEYPEYFYHD